MTTAELIATYGPLAVIVLAFVFIARRQEGRVREATALNREAVADQKRVLETLQEIRNLLKERRN